jgi:hypothetical protein
MVATAIGAVPSRLVVELQRGKIGAALLVIANSLVSAVLSWPRM